MKLKSFLIGVAVLAGAPAFAQTLDTEALAKVNPAAARQVYEVAQYVKLSGEQQQQLAKALQKENARFLEIIKQNEGVMTSKGSTQLGKMRDASLASILTPEQLEQYYRGVYNEEADAEGNNVANTLQKRYSLTDQNHKFIRVAFYKIGLETRVINKLMGDAPKKAAKKIKDLQDYYLGTIEEKGGLRVNAVDKGGKFTANPEQMTITWLREFNPNTLRKE